MLAIEPANTATAVADVRALFAEYWRTLGFDDAFQDFGEELRTLPGAYAAPHGQLGLARIDGAPAGCVALRRFDDRRAEAKRLYVRPAFRGGGAGEALLQWIVAEARRLGYAELLGDTMPSMAAGRVLYARTGFLETGPYSDRPTPGAIFLRLPLH